MSLLEDMNYLGLIPEDIPFLQIIKKQQEIETHKELCIICNGLMVPTNRFGCREILVLHNELFYLIKGEERRKNDRRTRDGKRKALRKAKAN